MFLQLKLFSRRRKVQIVSCEIQDSFHPISRSMIKQMQETLTTQSAKWQTPLRRSALWLWISSGCLWGHFLRKQKKEKEKWVLHAASLAGENFITVDSVASKHWMQGCCFQRFILKLLRFQYSLLNVPFYCFPRSDTWNNNFFLFFAFQ